MKNIELVDSSLEREIKYLKCQKLAQRIRPRYASATCRGYIPTDDAHRRCRNRRTRPTRAQINTPAPRTHAQRWLRAAAAVATPSRLSPEPRQNQLSSCRRRPRTSRRRTLRCTRCVQLRGRATEGCVQAGRTVGGGELCGSVCRFPQEDGQRQVGLLDLGVVSSPELTAGARGGGIIQEPGTLQRIWGSSAQGRTGYPCSRLTTGRGELGAP